MSHDYWSGPKVKAKAKSKFLTGPANQEVTWVSRSGFWRFKKQGQSLKEQDARWKKSRGPMEKEHIHSITSIMHSFPHSKNHIVAGWTMAISTEVCRRLLWAATEVPKFPAHCPGTKCLAVNWNPAGHMVFYTRQTWRSQWFPEWTIIDIH